MIKWLSMHAMSTSWNQILYIRSAWSNLAKYIQNCWLAKCQLNTPSLYQKLYFYSQKATRNFWWAGFGPWALSFDTCNTFSSVSVVLISVLSRDRLWFYVCAKINQVLSLFWWGCGSLGCYCSGCRENLTSQTFMKKCVVLFLFLRCLSVELKVQLKEFYILSVGFKRAASLSCCSLCFFSFILSWFYFAI